MRKLIMVAVAAGVVICISNKSASAGGWGWFVRHVHPQHNCRSGEREIVASYYWEGQRVASGGWFRPWGMTAAHRTMRFGAKLQVRNPKNHRIVVVTINDRGPYIPGIAPQNAVDLSIGAAKSLGMNESQYVCVAEVTRPVIAIAGPTGPRLADLHPASAPLPPARPEPRTWEDKVFVTAADAVERPVPQPDEPLSMRRDLILPIRTSRVDDETLNWVDGLTTAKPVLRAAPRHYTGTIEIEGKQFAYGTGGLDDGWSIPYGDYPITPNEVGSYGKRVGAIGVNHNTIWDHRLKRNRWGIELHRGNGMLSEGCVVVPRWQAFKRAVFGMIGEHGRAYLHIEPGFARIAPYPQPVTVLASAEEPLDDAVAAHPRHRNHLAYRHSHHLRVAYRYHRHRHRHA